MHLPEERRYGLGVGAYELGSAYLRQDPLRWIAPAGRSPGSWPPPPTTRTSRCSQGREVLYVIEERAPGRPGLVTDVGVRLPAHLTASGLAMLAALPPQQVNALFPSRRVLTRRHDAGPASLTQLRALLSAPRGARLRRGGRVRHARLRLGRLRRCATTPATRSRPSRVTYPAAEGEPARRWPTTSPAPPRGSRAEFAVAALDNTFRYGNMNVRWPEQRRQRTRSTRWRSPGGARSSISWPRASAPSTISCSCSAWPSRRCPSTCGSSAKWERSTCVTQAVSACTGSTATPSSPSTTG